MTITDISQKAGKILIVDDEENMRHTLCEIISDEGYDVQVASTGEEAIAMCQKNEFRVVLMDVRMPGINGVEAFREIQRHQKGTRVILMSAYSVDALKESALDDGAIAFLPKPLNLERVVRLISEVKDTAILVVEHEAHTADLLYTGLRERGYRITMAKSAHEALDLVEQIRFDLVFLNTNLPSMNGLELYLAIKKMTPSAMAIMITDLNKEFEAMAREAVRHSAYAVIRKPLDIGHVLGLLEKAVGRRLSGDLRKPTLDEDFEK